MHLRAALLAVPLAVAGLAVPAYAEPGLTVTWPTTTQVEVPNTTYTLTVADATAEPQGVLYAEWQGERTEIPHNGDHTMTFAKGGTGTIKVVRCVPVEPPSEPPAEPVCTDTGDVSPELTVVKAWDVSLERTTSVLKRGDVARYTITSPSSPNATVTADWSLRKTPANVVDSGTETTTLNDQGIGTFSVVIDAPTGSYDMEFGLKADIAPFGPHVGRAYDSFEVDDDAPTLSALVSGTAIYPHRDGYRDSLSLNIKSAEVVKAKIEVRRSSGTLVRTMFRTAPWYEHRVTIDGRSASGRLLAAGRYTLRVTVTDPVGLQTTKTTRSFVVSHKRLVTATWKRTFTAAAATSPQSAYVGKCSTLRRPSLRGWAGSLGYYSQTKCTRPADSAVTTVSGAWVPKAFQNRYGSLQVSMYGGGARGRGPHRGRNAYIVMMYRSTAKSYVHRAQFNGALGHHAGRSAAASSLVFDKATRPYVLWLTGLTEGSRYDVKSYTVKLTYTALR